VSSCAAPDSSHSAYQATGVGGEWGFVFASHIDTSEFMERLANGHKALQKLPVYIYLENNTSPASAMQPSLAWDLTAV